MVISKAQYISQLPVTIQTKIKSLVTHALSQLDLTSEEQSAALDNTLNSRLSDLENLIDINLFI